MLRHDIMHCKRHMHNMHVRTLNVVRGTANMRFSTVVIEALSHQSAFRELWRLMVPGSTNL